MGKKGLPQLQLRGPCLSWGGEGGGNNKNSQKIKYKLLAQRDLCQQDLEPLQKPGLQPRAPHPEEGRAWGWPAFHVPSLRERWWEGKRNSDFLRNSSLVPKGPPFSIEGLPRVQQVRAGHSSSSGKTGLQEPVPSPGQGPWEAGGRGRGGERSARLRMFPAQSWPQCKKLFTLLEESFSLIGSWRREMALVGEDWRIQRSPTQAGLFPQRMGTTSRGSQRMFKGK